MILEVIGYDSVTLAGITGGGESRVDPENVPEEASVAYLNTEPASSDVGMRTVGVTVDLGPDDLSATSDVAHAPGKIKDSISSLVRYCDGFPAGNNGYLHRRLCIQ